MIHSGLKISVELSLYDVCLEGVEPILSLERMEQLKSELMEVASEAAGPSCSEPTFVLKTEWGNARYQEHSQYPDSCTVPHNVKRCVCGQKV